MKLKKKERKENSVQSKWRPCPDTRPPVQCLSSIVTSLPSFGFYFFLLELLAWLVFFLGGGFLLSFVSLGSGFRRDRMTRRRDAVTGPFDVAAA